jgi:hypothetical protein
MRRSKYLGLKSGAWECTHVGIASVQPKYCKVKTKAGKRVLSSRPGHQTYYYIFERPTSDGEAMKMIRLNACQALKVLKGLKTVEEYAISKKGLKQPAFKDKLSYSFTVAFLDT